MLELFIIACLSECNPSAVPVLKPNLPAACEYAKDRVGVEVHRVVIGKSELSRKVTCKWVEKKEAHWEAEEVALPQGAFYSYPMPLHYGTTVYTWPPR